MNRLQKQNKEKAELLRKARPTPPPLPPEAGKKPKPKVLALPLTSDGLDFSRGSIWFREKIGTVNGFHSLEIHRKERAVLEVSVDGNRIASPESEEYMKRALMFFRDMSSLVADEVNRLRKVR